MLGNSIANTYLFDNTPTQVGTQQGYAPMTDQQMYSGEIPDLGIIDPDAEYEDVTNITENLYKKAAALKSLYTSALRNGIDPSAPDYTDPRQREIAMLFQQGLASTKNQANSLARSEERRKAYEKAYLESPETRELLNQGGMRQTQVGDFMDRALTEDTQNFIDTYATSFNSTQERDQANQAIDDKITLLQQELNQEADPRRAVELQAQIDALSEATATYDPTQDRDRAERASGRSTSITALPSRWDHYQKAISTRDNSMLNALGMAIDGSARVHTNEKGIHGILLKSDDGDEYFIDPTDPDGGAESFTWIIQRMNDNKSFTQRDVQQFMASKDDFINSFKSGNVHIQQDFPKTKTQVKSLFSPLKGDNVVIEDDEGESSTYKVNKKERARYAIRLEDIINGQNQGDEVLPFRWRGNLISGIEIDPETGEFKITKYGGKVDSSGKLVGETKEVKVNKKITGRDNIEEFIRENANSLSEFEKNYYYGGDILELPLEMGVDENVTEQLQNQSDPGGEVQSDKLSDEDLMNIL